MLPCTRAATSNIADEVTTRAPFRAWSASIYLCALQVRLLDYRVDSADNCVMRGELIQDRCCCCSPTKGMRKIWELGASDKLAGGGTQEDGGFLCFRSLAACCSPRHWGVRLGALVCCCRDRGSRELTCPRFRAARSLLATPVPL